MIVRFEKCKLKIDEIQKDDLPLGSFVDHERKVIELIRSWQLSQPSLKFKTSGSTGTPKTIHIARDLIEYSCQSTMNRLDPFDQFKSALLCLNPEMIGGAMVVFRALIKNLDLHVIAPQENPFSKLSEQHFDLVSVVPMQIQTATTEELNKFDSILVGGASYDPEELETTAKIYSSFGMTETVSHFALRLAGSDYYECVGDATIMRREDQRLEVSGTITSNESLVTNDLIEYQSETSFKWLGRADFVINSGGIKIHPEKVERKLRSLITKPFFVTSLKDERLGNKVVLVIQSTPYKAEVATSGLSKYEYPKAILFLEDFIWTASGKIDRIKTQESLIKLMGEKS